MDLSTKFALDMEELNKYKNLSQKSLVEWQHESDKGDVPMELFTILEGLNKDVEGMTEKVEEILKNPDYQFYHHVIHNRITEVEARFEATGRPFTADYIKEVDEAIDEVIYSTEEEFDAFYRYMDQKQARLVAEKMKYLRASHGSDVDALKYISESEQEFIEAEKEEMKLLASSLPDVPKLRGLPEVPKSELLKSDDYLDFQDEEEDQNIVYLADDFDDDELTEEQIQMRVTKKREELKSLKKKNVFEVTKSDIDEFTYKDPDDQDPNKLYKNYDTLQIYRERDDSDAYASVDRVMAHVKARERKEKREVINKKMKSKFDIED